MASIKASIQRLMSPAARQTPCRAAANFCTPRSFSVLGPLRAELGSGSQSAQVQATEKGKISEGRPQTQVVGRGGLPEGDQDHVEKDWEFDDFTTMGHSELERHREARQYARITAYEMPRLSGTPNTNLWALYFY